MPQQTLEGLAERLPAWARGWPRRRILASLAVVLLVVVLAVSCLGGAGGRADVPVLADGADAGVDGVRSPSEESGGTLRLVAPEIDSLDPQRSYLPGVWNLMRLYTRTLVTYSAEPGETDQLVPDLATDMGTVSEDGLTWTFTLREGVRFENGRDITAADLKYGFQRSFASDVIVGGPTYIVDLLDDPANPYPGPYSREEDDPDLTAIETPDPRTIVFRLRAPQPDFPYVLALPSSSPVPAEADGGAAYGTDPTSSGPYAITSVDPEAGILLERNPAWDPGTDQVRTALPDSVVVRTGLSGLERDQALLAGSADIDISGAGVQAATTARLTGEDDDRLAARIDDVTTGSLRVLALPTDVAPMNNPDCRTAVAAAVDRSAVQTALGGAANAVRSSELWPRGLAGGPKHTDPGPDLDAARAALETCGQPEGFSTVLAVADAPASLLVADEIAGQLAEVGIDVEVRPLDPVTFYATEVGNPDIVARNGYGIVLATRTADLPTPGSFLVPLVDGRSVRTVGNPNYARLDDPAVNTLVDEARAQGGDGWRAVAEAALGTSAYVPLAETRIQLLAGQRLHNGVVIRPYASYDVATAGVR
ncbi:ABC transporter substrate-binding protein [Blastococcus sp. TBT05-19]|uniref:ABC transporter substrate-binding protein n=1 Tax=Blastococcus sp. TBT05-19 TaxID=2250581 RepID=UPI000DEAD237|nr:ABC transporter substrate-binding protein [Blastococcus sp. TBT05-19]RBY86697.1 ABC transporter substrate-binding protein [Blastococcus sp. TBT05-19]